MTDARWRARAALIASCDPPDETCEPCQGYHDSSFADPPSYHAEEIGTCAMCYEAHQAHLIATFAAEVAREERERCARLAENPYSDEVAYVWDRSALNCGAAIAAAIRSDGA